MVVGVAGSGKTFLAHEIAKRVPNSVFISKDLVQSCFTNTERVNGKTYSAIRGPTFNLLLNFADMQLSHGKIPIIEGPFSRNFRLKDEFQDWPSHFRKLADKHNARFAIIRCKAPSQEELKKRIQGRGYVWDKEKLENWERWTSFEPEDFPIPHDDVHELVTDKPCDELSEEVILNYLEGKLIK
ncbi:ATP-binding protein [Candidatus Woesearchaeota archaeon]|nr:ATP-binding protein [Candidatus Woesearchaeota archaeon]